MHLKKLFGEKLYERLKPLRKAVLKQKRNITRQIVKGFNKMGLNIYPVNNYYSPLPVLGSLEKKKYRWIKPSSLAGVHYDMDKIKALFVHLNQYIPEYAMLLPYQKAKEVGFGPGYTYLDSITSYNMIRNIKLSEARIWFLI